MSLYTRNDVQCTVQQHFVFTYSTINHPVLHVMRVSPHTVQRVVLVLFTRVLLARVDAQACALGYTGPDGGPCVACAVAKYKASTGSAACTACRARSTSPEASTSSSACLCNAGLYLFSSGVGCLGCTAYTYKDVIGNQACTACPANTYAAADNPTGDPYFPRLKSSCVACPSGSSCPQSYCGHVRDCRCDPGHYGERESVCLPCDAGNYAPDVDHQVCYLCTPGNYQDQTGATSCKQCPPGTSSDYTEFGGPVTCTGCPDVFDPVTNACVTCAANMVWSGDSHSCVCANGFGSV